MITLHSGLKLSERDLVTSCIGWQPCLAILQISLEKDGKLSCLVQLQSWLLQNLG